MHIIHAVLNTFIKVLSTKAGLFNNQELLLLVIISSVLITFMCM